MVEVYGNIAIAGIWGNNVGSFLRPPHRHCVLPELKLRLENTGPKSRPRTSTQGRRELELPKVGLWHLCECTTYKYIHLCKLDMRFDMI